MEEPTKVQFTIGHMLIATTVLAVTFSMMRLFAPSGLAGVLAVSVFMGAVFLAIFQPDNILIRRIWWGMVALYVLACLFAIVI